VVIAKAAKVALASLPFSEFMLKEQMVKIFIENKERMSIPETKPKLIE
jgi:hypothetical protein